MTRKVKTSRDGTVTVTMNGRNNAKFWTAVEIETSKWVQKGYKLTHMQKGGNYFQDGILTSLLNVIRPIIGMSAIHDPVVVMTFAKY